MSRQQLDIALVAQPFDGVRPPRQNSVGISVYEYARRLARTHRVTVFAQRRRLENEPDLDEGVRYRYVSTRADHWLARQFERLHRGLRLPPVDFASPLFYVVYILRVALQIRREKFDVVHLLNFSQFAPVVRRASPDSRIVLNMRCEWLSQLPRRTVRRRLRHVDLIIGCSDHITRKVQERFPDLAHRCRTVYTGVDTEVFRPPDPGAVAHISGRRKVVFVGRVSPEKGIHLLVDALPMVTAECPDLQLEIVGSRKQLPLDFLVGISEDELVADLKQFYPDDSPLAYVTILRERLAAAGVLHLVEFTGGLPYPEVVARMQAADVLVNPSLSDAFPRSPMEAMACGVPVIASRVGGVVESVVDGETGFLVPSGDVAALATALCQLLTDEARRRAMGAAARRRAVDRFSWESVTRALEREYDDAVSEA